MVALRHGRAGPARTFAALCSAGNQESDAQTVKFGIREITAALNSTGALQFSINGQKILIRGGGWSPDMLLRQDMDRLQNEFRYVRDMNLNTIRLEGKLETDEFYNLADERGVLIMAGWCCCDIWEQWKHWQPADLGNCHRFASFPDHAHAQPSQHARLAQWQR